jgi:predicted permease
MALSAITVLGLGLGAAVAIFSVVYPVVLTPLPFDDPDRLVIAWQQDEQGGLREVSYREFQGWRDQARSFEAMAAIGSVNWSFQTSGSGDPYTIPISVVSASFFDSLGVLPLLGRTFVPADDDEAATTGRVVVLSHSLWVQRFDADPDIIGHSLRRLAGSTAAEPFTIVGVMPPAFQFPQGAHLWTPVGPELAAIRRAAGLTDMRFLRVLFVVGRLRPDVTIEAARTEIDTLIPRVQRDLAPTGRVEMLDGVVTSLGEHLFGNARTALLLFLGAVGLVLLIAIANVVGLLLVRSVERRRDAAVRKALGATDAHLLRYHLLEGAVIAAGGGALGIGLATVSVPALVALSPAEIPGIDAVAVDGRMLAFALVISAGCALLVGAGTSLRIRDSWIPHWLKSGSPTLIRGGMVTRTRDTLLVTQVALAVVSLFAATLLTASYANLVREDLGFRPEHVLTLDASLPDSRYSLQQKRLFYRELLQRVAALPGVDGVAAVYQRPFDNGPVGFDLVPHLRGQPPDGSESHLNPMLNVEAVTPDYFSVMGTRLLRGRTFTERDAVGSPLVVVVSDSTARRLWPRDEALGQQLLTVGDPFDPDDEVPFQTVVGVVEDARYREIETPRFDLYVPFYQAPLQVQDLVVRTAGDPLLLAGPVRDEIRRLDARQVVDGVRTMDMVVSRAMRPWQFNMVVSAALAAVALTLTALGLFGTVAYAVRQRTREIGLRIALGARTGHILDLVMRRVVVLTAVGSSIGLVLALGVARLFDSLVFGVAPRDPATLVAVTVMMSCVAIAASFLAARRWSRVDPMVALRAE